MARLSVEEVGRPCLETSTMAILTSSNVLKALQSHFNDFTRNLLLRSNDRPSALQTSAYRLDKLRQCQVQGVKMLVSASCDKRLETSQWTLKRLESDDDMEEIVEWLFVEARSLKAEAEQDAAEVIGRFFGV